MPYTGDHIKKEREALDLIIKMKKGSGNEGRGIEIVLFVIFPLILAVGVMQFKQIKDYAAHNHQISELIKVVDPSWQEAVEAPAGQTVPTGTGTGTGTGTETQAETPQSTPGSTEAPPLPEGSTTAPTPQAGGAPTGTASPGNSSPDSNMAQPGKSSPERYSPSSGGN